jgi:hypothetical protein
MNQPGATDLVTGAFSYSGAEISKRLLEAGRDVRTFTYHPDRPHPLQGSVDTRAYRFDDPARSLIALRG